MKDTKPPKQVWENRYQRMQPGIPLTSPRWVTPYFHIFELKHVRHVLEIGCGGGELLQVLSDAGYSVTGTDFASSAIKIAQNTVPGARLVVWDTRHPLPFQEREFDLIVASLSLHYFDDNTLSRIVANISSLLVRGGLFLFRMNSKNDSRAKQPQTIERHYFSLEDCRGLLSGWNELSLVECTITYDGREKTVCEGLYESLEA